MAIIEFKNVSRIYINGDNKLKALDNVSFEIEEGKFIVILGSSGAGKSTLLNLLGGLDSPTKGKILFEGEDIANLNNDELAEYRASTVGFIFQSYNLIPTLTVKENIILIDEVVDNALSTDEILKEVGLLKHKDKFPTELSGGEQQRVSIARAIAKNPKILLCDEPTGALDSETGVKILKLLLNMSKNYNKTIIVVTHNQNIAKIADCVMKVRNGRITSFEKQKSPLNVEEVEW
jgi:putative ABC transport system ATP-binding protein